ncbi:MAG: ATP-binding protein [Cyanomargarita calcarea GSE-NOS-MK-12-04C]|jgi:hypothetical protein|uniref:ATP-binding protein n=1 Tax=Cyanomargarita calcarea GSE-NOS-MK-12-04C TaxID=2839659 RepID=A0A951QS80_9CYAN|nr:ATP-binding protein [Cyanomargarita calcarea GSE-NOS-MK-12-04C]
MIPIINNILERFFAKDDRLNNTQIFGYFVEEPLKDEHLTLGFSPSRIALKKRWRNNGLSADFIAEYLTTFFPRDTHEDSKTNTKSEIKSAVSYIANELLENAIKYCDANVEYPITLHLELQSNEVRIFINNSVTASGVEKFKSFIKELSDSNPDEFYLRQLEKNAEDENNDGSGLGFLTIVNDYCAKIGWKFQIVQHEPDLIAVTTMVQLTV